MIQSEGMIGHLVRGLKEDNPELQMHCASAIFKVRTMGAVGNSLAVVERPIGT